MRCGMLMGLMAMGLGGAAMAGPILSPVMPAGDGHVGRDRYGFFSNWENVPFDQNASPNSASHWYDSSDANGASRTVYLQVAVPAGLSSADEISSATLNLYVTQVTGSGSRILHRTNASTATGNASQQLAGDVQLMDLTPANVGGTGWLAIDVTDALKGDVLSGFAWSVYSLPYKTNSSFNFASAESISTAPYLSVSVVPEPGSLGALAGVALLLIRRARG